MVNKSSLLAIVDFMYRNYLYKSVANEINYEAELLPDPYSGLNSSSTGDRTRVALHTTNLNHYILTRVQDFKLYKEDIGRKRSRRTPRNIWLKDVEVDMRKI